MSDAVNVPNVDALMHVMRIMERHKKQILQLNRKFTGECFVEL